MSGVDVKYASHFVDPFMPPQDSVRVCCWSGLAGHKLNRPHVGVPRHYGLVELFGNLFVEAVRGGGDEAVLRAVRQVSKGAWSAIENTQR